MAKKKKKKRTRRGGSRSHSTPRLTVSSLGSLSEEQDIVSAMLAGGEVEAAYVRAESLHKRDECSLSAALLARACAARIDRAIPDQKASQVRAMVKAAVQRLHGHGLEFERRLDYLSAWHGDAGGLLRPWAASVPSVEERTRLGEEVRRWIRDPRHVATCAALDEQHELRIAASGIWEAFSAVTRGPVADEQIALPEVSRRSPLAPWKYLVRALAHFYRGEDPEARRNAARIPADSAPGRLAPVIEAMMNPASPPPLPASGRRLVKRVAPDPGRLRRCLQSADRLIGRGHPRKQLQAVRNAVKACERTIPDLLEPLRQHASILCWLEDLPAGEVRRALGAPSRKDASFWRLLARASEIRADEHFHVHFLFEACSAWEEFRRHAIAEGGVAAGGPEEAAIYLRIAMLLRKPSEGVDPSDFQRRFDGHRRYYRDQPAEIRELAPASPPDTYFLFPHEVYAHAAGCHPSADVFQEWLDWAREMYEHWRPADEVALQWHQAMPDDPRPLLFLVDSAEQRNALRKAIGYLDRAEALDALDSRVVRARLRLLVSTARRHLKGGKLHLAEREFEQLAAQPGADGAHPQAFLEALRFTRALRAGDREAMSEHRDRVVRLAGGELAAHALLDGVATACGQAGDALLESLPSLPALLRQGDLPAAAVWAVDAGEQMACPLAIPAGWLGRLREDLASSACGLEPAALEQMAKAAMSQRDDRLAYLASGAGLRLGSARDARLLLLRAQVLPAFAVERRVQILRACLTLARRVGDTTLAGAVLDLHRKWTGQERGARVWGIPREIGELGDDELARALRQEREAVAYPTPATYDVDKYRDPDEELCDCPACRRARGELGPCDDEPGLEDLLGPGVEDLFDDIPDGELSMVLDELGEELADETGEQVPGMATAALLEMMQKFGGPDGELPDPEEVARRDPDLFRRLLEIGGMSDDYELLPPERKKRKKRRKRR